ncbi:hypothetical protein [Shewanella litorisediminis]|uniref:Uncharacterized protein n=1 Tax=Shewanella litorisediminis TaxID=1173586 RepID=A0ABX7G438_9GAMM|nr:hypothetical protein [Shewanella litorisediminis]MCL2919951.1 hypothetical protein [Shewanella litorisediminis]QRH02126.1 hypothetical protein JQC75_01455 [Shewanella litorisediminis]
MLNHWVKCFEYEDWQHFIRQINGHHPEKIDCAIVCNNNFEIFASKLSVVLKKYHITQIKWALTASLLDDFQVNSELIKKVLMRSAHELTETELSEMLNKKLIYVEKQNSDELNNSSIVKYFPTELGLYSAALQREKDIGRKLTEIELVEFGLSGSLCKLKSIINNTVIMW